MATESVRHHLHVETARTRDDDPIPSPGWTKPDKWVKVKKEPLPTAIMYPPLTRDEQKTPKTPGASLQPLDSSRVSEIPGRQLLDSEQTPSETEISVKNTDQKEEVTPAPTRRIDALISSCLACCSCWRKTDKHA